MNTKIKNFIIYFLMSILLFSPSLIGNYVEHLPLEIIYCLVIQGGLFLIPIVIFHKRLRLYFYLLLPMIILAPFVLIPPIFFGLEVNTDILTLVVNTTPQEGFELFGKLLVPFIISFLLYVLLYLLLVRSSIKSIRLHDGIATSILGIVVFLGGILIRSGTNQYYANVKAGLFSYYPTNLAFNVIKFSKKIRRIDHKELVKNFRYDAKKEDSLRNKEIYVLVIGETARFHNWGIYGYSRNTSPRLQKRTDLLAYTDVSTAGAMTELSIPLMITRALPNNFEQHYREKSVETAFKESGFQTYWISNQADYFNIQMHFKEVDSAFNLGDHLSGKEPIRDIEIVNKFQQVLNQNHSKRLFFILHTMGSHFNYNMRYPQSFDVFRPSGEGKSFNPMNKENKKIMVNAYDNSILYTDMILDSLMNILNKQNAVSYLIYLSDHGENLYDDDRMRFLHPPSVPTKFVAHIPFFVWTSSSYDSTYPIKYMELKKHVNNPVSSDNVFESLLDMANISYPGTNLSRSISSDKFQNSNQMILGGDMKIYYLKDLE